MATGEQVETADEYGRRSHCFTDHRRRPFRFACHVPYIRALALEPAPDGLVEQPHLRPCAIPCRTLRLEDCIDLNEELVARICSSPGPGLRQLLLLPRWAAFKEARIEVDELDLGSNPEFDLQNASDAIAAKRQCRLSAAWLPLSALNAERDEGLTFPAKSSKVRSLLCRELELERVASPDHLGYMQDENVASSLDSGALHGFASMLPCRHLAEALTPPLSPISDAASPFIPSAEAAVIDLTSEPESPSAAGNRRDKTDVDCFCIESDILASSSTAGPSPSTWFNLEVQPKHPNTRDIILDVPLVPAGSDTVHEPDALSQINLLSTLDSAASPTMKELDEGLLDGMITNLWDKPQFDPASVVEQEQLNPTDSIARLPVPVLDFRIPQPDWAHQVWSDREHFSWLQTDSPATFELPCLPSDAQLDSSLKWAPAHGKDETVLPADGLEAVTALQDIFCADHSSDSLQSAKYLSIPQRLAVLDAEEDTELEESGVIQTGVEVDGLKHAGIIRTHDTCRDQRMRRPLCTQDGEIERLLQPPRRKDYDRNALFPQSTDASATSKLLAGFMELRAVKRPRIGPPADSLPYDAKSRPFESPSLVTAHETVPIPKPAPVPQFEMPDVKGPCIISVALPRPVVQHIGRSWPQQLIIDRDYSRYDDLDVPMGSTTAARACSPLAWEADICLAPGIGVLLTTLLKVGQRPLPGSKTQSPLRERLDRVSQKYETLIVLVSESSPSGEFAGELTASGTAAFAEFACFAASLEADVTTYLVSGADQTLSAWILALLCRYNAHAAAFKRSVSLEESAWELFLRRAGLNVFAAQVLSKALVEEFGDEGLAQFLAMPTQQKLSKYQQLVGGRRVLRKCCQSLDGEDGPGLGKTHAQTT